MPFGLSGAPATFQGAMNDTLKKYLRKFVLVFFDDILIYGKMYEEHLQHNKLVLAVLQQEQWYVKLDNCSFGQKQLSYLGHVISGAGVATLPGKIQDVESWKIPANAKELRGFLGLVGYYRRFVRHFGIIAKPLTRLLQKNVQFRWNSEADTAFLTLKKLLTTAPVLALPDFSKQFILEKTPVTQG